jgi:hypothetical protein
MYYWLINATKRRLIEELRDSFAGNPYFQKIVPYIQDKFSFKERPQFGIVVKGSSGDRIPLSPQNFIGIVHSYCLKATIQQHPGIFLDWIREDTIALQQNKGVFPSPAGIYLLELTDVDDMKTKGKVLLDVVSSINDENVIEFKTGLEQVASLKYNPIPKSLRLYITSSLYGLKEGVDYEINGKVITFLTPFLPYTTIYADYKVLKETKGPYDFEAYASNNTIIPGVVLAFGNQLQKGDRCAIIVTDKRTPAFEEYGGHYEITLDIDAIARDTTQCEQIADFSIMTLLNKKVLFENDGLTFIDGPTLGSQSEEIYDEEGDEYYYTNSFNITFLTDWAYYIPLPLDIAQVISNTVYQQVIVHTEKNTLDIEKFF